MIFSYCRILFVKSFPQSLVISWWVVSKYFVIMFWNKWQIFYWTFVFFMLWVSPFSFYVPVELFGWKPPFGTYELINKRLKTKIRPKKIWENKYENINQKLECNKRSIWRHNNHQNLREFDKLSFSCFSKSAGVIVNF